MNLSTLIRNMGQSGQGGAATINHVDEHQLGPAVARAGMALRDFSKNTLVPTVADVGKKLGGFGKHQVAPMMARGGAALNDFGKNKLGPAVVGSKAAIDQFGKSKQVFILSRRIVVLTFGKGRPCLGATERERNQTPYSNRTHRYIYADVVGPWNPLRTISCSFRIRF